jgi:hypothetical protein
VKACFRPGHPALYFPYRGEDVWQRGWHGIDWAFHLVRSQIELLPRALVPHGLNILADTAAQQDIATTIQTVEKKVVEIGMWLPLIQI